MSPRISVSASGTTHPSSGTRSRPTPGRAARLSPAPAFRRPPLSFATLSSSTRFGAAARSSRPLAERAGTMISTGSSCPPAASTAGCTPASSGGTTPTNARRPVGRSTTSPTSGTRRTNGPAPSATVSSRTSVPSRSRRASRCRSAASPRGAAHIASCDQSFANPRHVGHAAPPAWKSMGRAAVRPSSYCQVASSGS